MPVMKIYCIKCSLNKTNYISSDEDDGYDSEDDVIVIGYKPSCLKQGEELGNTLEFYFCYSGSVDEIITIKFLEKEWISFRFLSFKQQKETEKEFYYNYVVNS